MKLPGMVKVWVYGGYSYSEWVYDTNYIGWGWWNMIHIDKLTWGTILCSFDMNSSGIRVVWWVGMTFEFAILCCMPGLTIGRGWCKTCFLRISADQPSRTNPHESFIRKYLRVPPRRYPPKTRMQPHFMGYQPLSTTINYYEATKRRVPRTWGSSRCTQISNHWLIGLPHS